MFPQSSQKKYWMFSDENDLTVLREKTNAEFIERHGANMTVSRSIFCDKLSLLFRMSISQHISRSAWYF